MKTFMWIVAGFAVGYLAGVKFPALGQKIGL